MDLPGIDRFHLLAVQLGEESEVVERVVERLHLLDPGSIAVLPELVAWTDEQSETALAALVEIARQHGLGIITTLNLPPELCEDLPGRDPDARYNAVVIVTRHGALHVPQAKTTPRSFETSRALGGPNIGVAAYRRINRVRLDLGPGVVEARFLVSTDLWALAQLGPRALRSDLFVVPAGFPHGAEETARRLLELSRAGGVARATILVNASGPSPDPARAGEAIAVEELVEHEGPVPVEWPDPAVIRAAFSLGHPVAAGHIAVPRALAEAPLTVGEYPITITL